MTDADWMPQFYIDNVDLRKMQSHGINARHVSVCWLSVDA